MVSDKSLLVFTEEDDGYSPLCLELDVASQGETLEEARENLIEAVSLYIESAIHEWSDVDLIIIKKTSKRAIDRILEATQLVNPKRGY